MIKIEACAPLPTKHWDFIFSVALNSKDNKEHLIISKGIDVSWKTINKDENVLTRIHSECITWDLFWSKRCDCWSQFKQSLKLIEKEWKWLMVYLRQEWRWIWLIEKIKAYNLQDQGLDTVQANEKLWFKADMRGYKVAADILKKIWIKKLKLITNNQKKKEELKAYWIEISNIISLKTKVSEHNRKYLETKVEKMGHVINF